MSLSLVLSMVKKDYITFNKILHNFFVEPPVMGIWKK